MGFDTLIWETVGIIIIFNLKLNWNFYSFFLDFFTFTLFGLLFYVPTAITNNVN